MGLALGAPPASPAFTCRTHCNAQLASPLCKRPACQVLTAHPAQQASCCLVLCPACTCHGHRLQGQSCRPPPRSPRPPHLIPPGAHMAAGSPLVWPWLAPVAQPNLRFGILATGGLHGQTQADGLIIRHVTKGQTQPIRVNDDKKEMYARCMTLPAATSSATHHTKAAAGLNHHMNRISVPLGRRQAVFSRL